MDRNRDLAVQIVNLQKRIDEQMDLDYARHGVTVIPEGKATSTAVTGDFYGIKADGTGTNVEKYLQWINEARELGYTIVLFYVKVAASTSLKRNARRDRKVPEEVIVEKAGIINQSTELIGSVCDKFVVLKND